MEILDSAPLDGIIECAHEIRTRLDELALAYRGQVHLRPTGSGITMVPANESVASSILSSPPENQALALCFFKLTHRILPKKSFLRSGVAFSAVVTVFAWSVPSPPNRPVKLSVKVPSVTPVRPSSVRSLLLTAETVSLTTPWAIVLVISCCASSPTG